MANGFLSKENSISTFGFAFVVIWTGIALYIGFRYLLEKKIQFDNNYKKFSRGEKNICSYDEVDYIYLKKQSGGESSTYYTVSFQLKNKKKVKILSIYSKKVANQILKKISSFTLIKIKKN